MPKLFANQFSTELILATCAPALGHAFAFGFSASYVRVENLAAVPIHVNFNSTDPASTDDPELRAGQTMIVDTVLITGGGLSTTSTTTSTEDDGHRVTVAAFGG